MIRRTYRTSFLAVASFVVIIVMSLAFGGFRGTPTTAQQPTSTPMSIPAVTANNQWKPVTQTFDGVEMVLVPPGCFMMGSTEAQIVDAFELAKKYHFNAKHEWHDDETPVHQVCFDRPFWIDKYEVTNGQFIRLGGKASRESEFTGVGRPREQITWFEARDFCAKRSARLPTEAEWEYAARGPDALIFPWGNDFVADNVVYSGNSGGQTADVGSRPGGISWVGALDLSGNVWEWVADWYDATYYAFYVSSPKNDPQGPSSGPYRALRGGSWVNLVDSSHGLRAPDRFGIVPDFRSFYVGFRCARSLE